MTIELSKILSFSSFYEKIKKEKIPFKIAHQLFQLNQEVKPHISFYYDKANEIVAEFGERDSENKLIFTEDGFSIKIKQDKIEDCQKKFKELEELKIQIRNFFFEPDDFSCLNLSIEDLQGIIPFIKELSD